MAKVNKVRCKSASRCHRMAAYSLPSCPRKAGKGGLSKKRQPKASEKKDWEGATCPVCLEFPHNAVLLLCSSYHKGCRPYMCATSRRFANCLEQYKKTYTKVSEIVSGEPSNGSMEHISAASDESEVPELLCPLCRGQVKGWTVVEPARKHLNARKRSCMQEKCLFVGTYKELRKHVKANHPLARPRAVDPVLREKWKKLERERDRGDVISILMSSIPGAMVLGDYVIEPGYHDMYSDCDSDDSLDDRYFPVESLGRGQSRLLHWRGRSRVDYDSLGEDHLPSGPVVGRIQVGASRRRWRSRGGDRTRLFG